MTSLAKLCEDINRGVPTDTSTQAVNLYQIDPEDWEALQQVEKGEQIPEADLSWLKECGLVVVEGTSVSLSQLAQSWLHPISQ